MTAIYDLLSAAMRNRFGGSVTRLSEACDVSTALASRWVAEEERKRITPSPASCEKIAVGLNMDPDYVLELAGHRKPRPGRLPVDPVQSELDARLTRLGTALSRYPRAFWLAVIEASERLAEAGDALAAAEPPVSDPGEGGVSSPGRPLKRDRHDQEPPLAHRYPAAGLAHAGI